jgi:hypothetical protein
MLNAKHMKQKSLLIILVIIAIVTLGIAAFFIKNGNSQKQISQPVSETLPLEKNNIAVQSASQLQENNTAVPEEKVGEEYYKRENKDGYTTDWKLVFVNGGVDNIDEECSAHVYEGKTKIGGWYTYEEMYSDKYWFLNIAYYYDKNGKKVISDANNVPKVRIVDASNALVDELKKASKNNPKEFAIQGLYAHCEGSVVSIDLGRKAFAEDIKAGIWTHNTK